MKEKKAKGPKRPASSYSLFVTENYKVQVHSFHSCFFLEYSALRQLATMCHEELQPHRSTPI